MVFDPTPAGDIPALSRPSGRERIRWAVDWVQSTWDRYVLTFGFGEQIGLVTAAANGIEAVLRRVSWRHLPWAAAIVTMLALAWWLMRRRLPPKRRLQQRAYGPAAQAVRWIAARLEREGVEVPPRATVRWISNSARQTWPSAGTAVGELAWLAERELYAAEGLRPGDRAIVRSLWKQARLEMR
jgi:hypothetical protein